MNTTELKADLSAGFSVALVALPLSIGIALASGAPASSGLIAAIIGGILGSWMGGSHVTINGPAAGLIVIVLDAIVAMGHGDPMQGFRGMLAASVVAGAIQIALGALKLGQKGSSFPASVIHGMMAAIGLIIISKQIHVLMGHTPDAKNPVMLYLEIPKALMNINLPVFTAGAASLVLLVALSRIKSTWAKKVPGALLAVIVGSILAMSIGIPAQGLLQIPSDFSKWIIFPDFSVMSTFAGWKAALTMAIVASLETVLSATAVDKLDTQKRKSNMDRDLLSKGVCNLASGLIGGLPMIAEIVRSSANVSYGAKTWKSNFFHGIFVLALVVFASKALALVPLASLAAVLIMVGSRLGSPAHLMHAWKIGFDNMIGFAVTLFVTLGVDLLAGILAGAFVQFAVEMRLGLKFKDLFKASFLREETKDVTIKVSSALAFSNFLALKNAIHSHIKDGKNVTIDLTECNYIDHSVMEELHDLEKEFHLKNLSFCIVKSAQHRALGEDNLSAIRKVA